jgi:ABC-type amino acid transport/signal transduction systems, periplasmic component/domain
MRKSISIIAGIAAVAFVALVASGCSGKDTKVFRVGMECAYAPFNWTQQTDANGAVKIADSSVYANGYDVQVAKKLAASLGKELVVVKTEWDGLIPAVQNGKIDAIIAGMCGTPKRAQAVDFSKTYYNAKIIMITLGSSKYAKASSLKDFASATVTSQLNTVGYDLLSQVEGAKVLPGMDTTPSLLVALLAGKIDAYSTDIPTGLSIIKSNPQVKIVDFPDGTGFKVDPTQVERDIAVKKGSAPLLDKVNKFLETLSDADRAALMQNAIDTQPLAQ